MSIDVSPLEYLTALYGRCDRGQIVLVDSSRRSVSKVFNVDQLELAAQHIARVPDDLFIKVNPLDYKQITSRNPFGIGGTGDVVAVVGFHLDVDAGKNDKYLTREKMLDAIAKMPLTASAIIETNGDTGGFHAYWWLEEPIYIDSEEQRADLQQVSNRWLHELREFASPGTIDGTADLCRVLRPVGSLRPKTGNRVRALQWNPEQRYTLDQFRLPKVAKVEQTFEPRHDGESIIEKYLDEVGENHPATLLERYAGYTRVQDGFYIRPGSESGSPTGEVYRRADGSLGFTFKSGACEPFTSTNKNGTNGNWYSAPAIYVMLCHGDDWKAAAKHCHEFLRVPEDYSWIDRMTVGNESGQPKPNEDDTSRESTPTQPSKPSPKAPEPPTTPAGRLLTAYMQQLNTGELPQLLPQSGVLDGVEIGPGLLTMIGAPPGFGKTALAMQILFDALELNEKLVATVANAETTFDGLLRREITRMTRIDSDAIRFGRLTTHELERINTAASELIPRLQRVAVLNDPCDTAQLYKLRDEPPGLLIVDYLQKFASSDKDTRQAVNAVVAVLRHLAKLGWAVLCLSATKRDSNGKHNSKELGLSSFRESGEIEYNADSAYVMIDQGELGAKYIRHVTLSHVKNRHGAKVDRQLRFHMPRMSFGSLPTAEPLGNPEFGGVVELDDPFYSEAS